MKLPLEGRWLWLAVAIAAVFAGALVLAVRFISLPTPPAATSATNNTVERRVRGIGLAPMDGRAGSELQREQALLDPDPLFLPTEFNASQPRLPEIIRREPGASFQPVAAKYAFSYAEAPIAFPEVVTVPPRPVDSLTYGHEQNPYEVLGRFAREESPLPARLAIIEVVQASTGRVVLSTPLTTADAPPQVVTADWPPLELLAAVDVTGLIGTPVLTRKSGIEAVDKFFRSYLAKQFHLGERLPPGLYMLRVGP